MLCDPSRSVSPHLPCPLTLHVPFFSTSPCSPCPLVPCVPLFTMFPCSPCPLSPSNASTSTFFLGRCWLTEPIIHQVLNLGFFAAVLLFNLCMFVAMTRRALRLSPHSRQEEVRRCVTLLGLSCMLGFSWGLAFFSFGVFYLPVQYAFSILNALQG